ncbi:hypothetical protein JW796_01775 [Candidatus Dojkabacteria bacterium]|nr:hypothetical protein [Candidatus Dojkabacteria bacterium]
MSRKGFNLLQPQEAPATFWDKAYAWVVGTARVIIILVEVIVFAAFVTRFVLDSQTKNLDEKIRVQEARLEVIADKEKYFRGVIGKANAYQEIWETSSGYADIWEEINMYLPTISSEINVQFKNEILLIRGFSALGPVSTLEGSLKNSQTFQRTEVFEVQNEGGEGVDEGTFALRAIVKDHNSRFFK